MTAKFDAVAKLLVEPPSYDRRRRTQNREGSAAGLKAIVGTVGEIEDDEADGGAAPLLPRADLRRHAESSVRRRAIR